jgi:type I restriction enzyme, S subunit
MAKLPTDWASTVLNDIAKVEWGDTTITKKSYKRSGYPAFSATGQDGYLEFAEWEGSAVILSAIGARCGKCFFAEGKFTAIKNTIVIQANPNFIDHKLLYLYLNDEKKWSISGSGQPFITMGAAKKVLYPLPPISEQRRIVAKLEKLLAKVDACKERLEKIPAILKRFRQSVLAAACSGDLTRDWRNEKKTTNCTQLKELGCLTEDVKGDFEISASSTSLRVLPDTWKWIALGNYAELSRGRFSARPRNDPKYFDGKYPFIQIGDLPKDGGFISSHRQTLNDLGLSVSKKFPAGTVVIAIVGATIGNTGILSYEMCFPDSLVGIETGTATGNVFVEFFLRTEKEKLRTISYSSGGQPNIKLETLNPYPFPCPPMEEQHEIVRRVEALFKIADDIEKRYQKAKAQVDKLTQSILAKAFRGELVPQDPNDEPASELLKRIQAERKNQETEARPNRKSTSRRVKN